MMLKVQSIASRWRGAGGRGRCRVDFFILLQYAQLATNSIQ